MAVYYPDYKYDEAKKFIESLNPDKKEHELILHYIGVQKNIIESKDDELKKFYKLRDAIKSIVY